jgi:hypothetical protein
MCQVVMFLVESSAIIECHNSILLSSLSSEVKMKLGSAVFVYTFVSYAIKKIEVQQFICGPLHSL